MENRRRIDALMTISPGLKKTVMTLFGLMAGGAGAALVAHPKFSQLGAALLWIAGVLKGGALIQAPATTEQLVKRAADAVAAEEK